MEYIIKKKQVIAQGKTRNIITKYHQTESPIHHIKVKDIWVEIYFVNNAKCFTQFKTATEADGWGLAKAQTLHIPIIYVFSNPKKKIRYLP